MKNGRLFIGGTEVRNFGGIFPRGVFYGDGVFETVRWRGFPPVFLDRHIDRMLRGAEVLKIPKPDRGKTVAEIADAARKTGFSDCAVKMCLVSGGDCSPFFAEPDSFRTAVFVTEKTGGKPPRAERLFCRREQHLRGASPLAGIKSLNRLEHIIAIRDAAARGFDDALFLDRRGFVAETTRCNIFWGKGANLSTPPPDCGALPGVTAGVLTETARRNGFAVSHVRLPPEDLAHADFVFVTNAVAGIIPVEKLQIEDLTFTFSSSEHDSYLKLKNLLYQTLMWE